MIDTQTLRAVAGYPGTSKETLIMFLLKAADEIDRLKRGGWISVKDRLPEKCTEILIYAPNHGCIVAKYSNNEFWDTISCYVYSTDEITHWMPLPAPPGD